jgi:hypothetical protein
MANTSITPPSAAVLLSGRTAPLVVSTVLSPQTTDVLLTGQTPPLGTSTSLVPQTGAAVFSGKSPLLTSLAILPQRGTLAFTGQAPTPRIAIGISPLTAAVAYAGQPPILTAVAQFPQRGTVALSGAASLLLLGTVQQPPPGSLGFSGQAPITRAASFVFPQRGVLAFAADAPGVYVAAGGQQLFVDGNWVKEKLIGTIDGSNNVFQTTYVPVEESLLVLFTGVLLEAVGSQPGQMQYAYVVDGKVVTLGLAPVAGQRPWARYWTEDL